jgi:hypothetical protein
MQFYPVKFIALLVQQKSRFNDEAALLFMYPWGTTV